MTVEAFTAVDDVRACEVREADTVLAATAGGLVRVTGGKVDHVWTVLDGLPDTKTEALFVEASSGSDARVWIGTERGLAEAKLSSAGVSVVRTFPSAPVRAIVRAKGKLYVGTFGDGVLELAGGDGASALKKVPFSAAKGPSAQLRVTSLATFGDALVAGTAGAGVFRMQAGKLGALWPGDGGASSVFALAVSQGRLVVGGVGGAFSLDETGAPHLESTSDVRALGEVSGELWGAAFGTGLVRIGKPEAGQGSNGALGAGLPKAAKWAQAFDAGADARCLGTAHGLFVKSAKATSWSEVATKGLPSNDVNVIAREGDRLWVGTYDEGLAVLAAGTWKTSFGASLDDRINALAVGKKAVWVGTTRGLVRIDATTQTVTDSLDTASGLPSADVHSLTMLSSGALLVGTTKGAAIVEGKTVTPLAKKQGLSIDTAWAVAEGPKGALLVGASTGLYVRAPKQTKWQRLSVMSGQLPDDWVTALVVRGDEVFVGTYSGGVARITLDLDDVAASGAAKLGGGYVNLAGLTLQGGSLYAATMDGLLVRSLDGGAVGATEWKKLPKAALGPDVTGIVAAPDGLWVGSRRGLVHTT